MLWRSNRHFDATFVIGLGLVTKWYHACSWALRFGVSLIMAKFVLYFLAVFNFLFLSLLRCHVHWPFMGTFHNWRKGLFLALFIVLRCLGLGP